MQIPTGIDWLDKVLTIAGALYILLSTILLFIPKSNKIYSPLAIFAADLKALLGKSDSTIAPLPIPPEKTVPDIQHSKKDN